MLLLVIGKNIMLMNNFGRIFRVSVFGESHGDYVGVTIDGVPAGIAFGMEDMIDDLQRRQSGLKGTTSRKEQDMPIIISGVFEGHTTGAPLSILFKNKDIRSRDYSFVKSIPRPGHADFVAGKKYGGYQDYRGGGHFSGRLTLPLVAAGALAKKIIAPIVVNASILTIGGEKDYTFVLEKAIKKGDSLGGILQCKATGMPTGLGEPFFDSLESVISHIVFSIPAVKGIEFGLGFAFAGKYGSEANDVIVDANGKTATNNSGGINGGISNGNELQFNVVVKPTSSIALEQRSYNFEKDKIDKFRIKGRHDTCIALRVPPVLEAVTAIVLADMLMINRAISHARKP